LRGRTKAASKRRKPVEGPEATVKSLADRAGNDGPPTRSRSKDRELADTYSTPSTRRNRLARPASVGYPPHEVRGASSLPHCVRRPGLLSLPAKALAAPAVLGLAFALSPSARAAEMGPDPGRKPFNPKIVIVVECVRRTDMKAARDFIAYMTREPPADMEEEGANGKPVAVSSQKERFTVSASLSSARQTAERDKAVAIVHVKIIKREPTVRGGAPEMQANCSVLLPSVSKASPSVSWKVKQARILPPPRKAGLVLIGGAIAPGDPLDFAEMKQEITRLIYDAAVEVTMPPIRKAPKSGERIEVKVTNNTLLGIAAFDVSMASKGTSCTWKYSGDPLPPGKSDVTVEADLVDGGMGGRAVGDRPARAEQVRFAEPPVKK